MSLYSKPARREILKDMIIGGSVVIGSLYLPSLLYAFDRKRKLYGYTKRLKFTDDILKRTGLKDVLTEDQISYFMNRSGTLNIEADRDWDLPAGNSRKMLIAVTASLVEGSNIINSNIYATASDGGANGVLDKEGDYAFLAVYDKYGRNGKETEFPKSKSFPDEGNWQPNTQLNEKLKPMCTKLFAFGLENLIENGITLLNPYTDKPVY